MSTTRESKTIASNLSFGEAPRWHDDRLWISDFFTGRVLSMTETGDDLRVEAEVPNQPSGLGWLPDGRLLVVSMLDAKILRREHDGTLAVHADLANYVGGHLNDMVVDASGRAYAGNFGFNLMSGKEMQTASLVRVDPDGSISVAAKDLWFPNGSAITPDGKTFLVNETMGNRISALDIDPVTGALTNRRDWARFGPLPTSLRLEEFKAVVQPDGGCLDAEGCIWAADAGKQRLLRVEEGGRIVDEIAPGQGVFACMLGGADGRTLFACLAPDYFEHARKAAREASIVAYRVEVPRAGLP